MQIVWAGSRRKWSDSAGRIELQHLHAAQERARRCFLVVAEIVAGLVRAEGRFETLMRHFSWSPSTPLFADSAQVAGVFHQALRHVFDRHREIESPVASACAHAVVFGCRRIARA